MRIEVDEERSAVTDFQNERSQNGQCQSLISLGSMPTSCAWVLLAICWLSRS
jgi:hypothetical protein